MWDRARRWYVAEFALLVLVGLLLLEVATIVQLLLVRAQLEEVRRSATLIGEVRSATQGTARLLGILESDADLRRDQLALVSMRLSLIEQRLAARGATPR